LSLVKKNKVFVHKPRTGEPKYLRMADKAVTVPRIGYVKIPITVEFKGGAERIPYSCTKQFEVLNMDYPFILGVDILPSIFPNDDIMNYLLLPSRITTPPVPHIGSVVCDINNENTRTSISDFNDKSTIDFDYNNQFNRDVVDTSSNVWNDYIINHISDNYTKLMMNGLCENVSESYSSVDPKPSLSITTNATGSQDESFRTVIDDSQTGTADPDT